MSSSAYSREQNSEVLRGECLQEQIDRERADIEAATADPTAVNHGLFRVCQAAVVRGSRPVMCGRMLRLHLDYPTDAVVKTHLEVYPRTPECSSISTGEGASRQSPASEVGRRIVTLNVLDSYPRTAQTPEPGGQQGPNTV